MVGCIDVDSLVFERTESGAGGSGGEVETGSSVGTGGGSGGLGGAGGGGGSVDPTSYAELVLSDGPLVYYRFEESASATTVPDASGAGFDAVLFANGGTAERGVSGALSPEPGNALRIGGGAQVVLSPNQLGLGNLSAYTVEAWIRVDGGEGASAVMRWRDATDQQAGFHTFFWTGSVHHKRYDAFGAFEEISYAPAVMTGGFHHLVVAVDVPSAAIYLDGALLTNPSFQDFSLDLPDHASPVLVADTPFDAQMTLDELALYPFAFEPQDVDRHHRCGTQGLCGADARRD
jgi:hypothetical protein